MISIITNDVNCLNTESVCKESLIDVGIIAVQDSCCLIRFLLKPLVFRVLLMVRRVLLVLHVHVISDDIRL